MRMLSDAYAHANRNADRHNIVVTVRDFNAVERSYVLSPTLAEVLMLSLGDALEYAHERNDAEG